MRVRVRVRARARARARVRVRVRVRVRAGGRLHALRRPLGRQHSAPPERASATMDRRGCGEITSGLPAVCPLFTFPSSPVGGKRRVGERSCAGVGCCCVGMDCCCGGMACSRAGVGVVVVWIGAPAVRGWPSRELAWVRRRLARTYTTYRSSDTGGAAGGAAADGAAPGGGALEAASGGRDGSHLIAARCRAARGCSPSACSPSACSPSGGRTAQCTQYTTGRAASASCGRLRLALAPSPLLCLPFECSPSPVREPSDWTRGSSRQARDGACDRCGYRRRRRRRGLTQRCGLRRALAPGPFGCSPSADLERLGEARELHTPAK